MKLNVARGNPIQFAFDGKSASGVIVSSSHGDDPTTAAVAVETDAAIPKGVRLTIPDLPETGGCGTAQPVPSSRGVRVVLHIGYSCVDIATIGK